MKYKRILYALALLNYNIYIGTYMQFACVYAENLAHCKYFKQYEYTITYTRPCARRAYPDVIVKFNVILYKH